MTDSKQPSAFTACYTVYSRLLACALHVCHCPLESELWGQYGRVLELIETSLGRSRMVVVAFATPSIVQVQGGGLFVVNGQLLAIVRSEMLV